MNSDLIKKIMVCIFYAALIVYLFRYELEDQYNAHQYLNDIGNRKEINMLFIGNSHTYYNNMPKIVEILSRVSTEPNFYIKTEMVAYGGFTMEEHWNNKKALQMIYSKNWDYIVLQGQSSSMIFKDSIDSFNHYAGNFIKQIKDKDSNSQIILYATWPYKKYGEIYKKLGVTYNGMLNRVNRKYYEAAYRHKTGVVYTGPLFHKAERLNINPYNNDGNHANFYGSSLVGMSFYKYIFPDANIECNKFALVLSISEEVCNSLQRIVNES